MDTEHIAFIWKWAGLVNTPRIKIDVAVPGGARGEYVALIDTGATNTCITEKVAKELGLIQTGVEVDNHTAGSQVERSPTYVADIILKASPGTFLSFEKNLVIQIGPSSTHDVLIGMDILNKGDFALTNKNSKTQATFSYPSSRELDFVPDSNNHNRFLAESRKREANRNLRKSGGGK